MPQKGDHIFHSQSFSSVMGIYTSEERSEGEEAYIWEDSDIQC